MEMDALFLFEKKLIKVDLFRIQTQTYVESWREGKKLVNDIENKKQAQNIKLHHI